MVLLPVVVEVVDGMVGIVVVRPGRVQGGVVDGAVLGTEVP